MNKYSKLLAILLLVLGILVAAGAWLLQPQQRPVVQSITPTVQESKKYTVVMAAQDLPAGHVITPADVSVANLSHVPAYGLTSSALVIGRSTAVEIVKDAPLLKTQLLDGVAGMLTAGERAVSIKVDEASAVGHKVKPGDWVDVFVVLKQDGQVVEDTQARLLLPKKRVLAYGAQLPESAQAEPSEEEGSKKNNANAQPKPQTARTAVLGVQVEEINRLLLAEQYGSIQLALRSPLDVAEPSAERKQQVPGLTLTKALPADADPLQAAIDASLLALKMQDIAKDKLAETKAAVSKPASRPSSTRKAAGNEVEIIRGTELQKTSY